MGGALSPVRFVPLKGENDGQSLFGKLLPLDQ